VKHDIQVEPHEVFTAVLAGVGWLERREIKVVAPFVTPDALEDLSAFKLVGGTSGMATAAAKPEVVLIGDVGDAWSHGLLNEAFRYVMDGASLLALQRGKYWQGPSGLELDAGAYVAALEYATGATAVVCGKPNTEFFEGAVLDLGVSRGPMTGAASRPPVVMIGDDLWSDIDGAQRAGLEGWLVKTGKFRPDVLESATVVPDRIIESVAVLGDNAS
jgi:HAD superfamily hydrolase (TIGR01458 family)